MKMRILMLPGLLLIAGAVFAQTAATIEKVEITGISDQLLSADLRDSIQKLNGQRYDVQAAEQLANRIQSEVKDVVAAARTQPGTQAGRVRLVFVVAHSTPDSESTDTNVNSQYTVESVEVKGLLRSQYSDKLYDELQNMVGKMLDNKSVEDFQKRLIAEPLLNGKYSINHKIERGSQPEHVKVVFEAEKVPWPLRKVFGNKINLNGGISIGNSTPGDMDEVESVDIKGVRTTLVSETLRQELQKMVGKRFDKLEADHLRDKLEAELKSRYKVKWESAKGSKEHFAKITYDVEEIPWLPYLGRPSVGAYHQKQGVSLFCCEVTPFNFGVGTDGDTLIERYKGFSAGVESQSLGSRRFGARLNLSTFGIEWKSQTLLAAAANPAVPGVYRSRQGIDPSVAFAFNRNFYVVAGLSFTELEMIEPSRHWQSAHAASGVFHYDSKEIKRGNATLWVTAGYYVHTGAKNLGSDFSYTQHLWASEYLFKNGDNSVKVSMRLGRLTGNAPLFERFSLGNTQTLRGWNKYDLDPIGGTRMVSWSTTLTHDDFGFYVDTGGVWDRGGSLKLRQSLGIVAGPISLGFPLRCSGNCGPNFMIRF